MKHVVNFSGGVCSFWAAKRVVEKYGTADTHLLFADTLIEDEDLYRFNKECSSHLGIPITRITTGLTPWELFRKQGMIANARFPICSIYLKRDILDEWHTKNCTPGDTTIYIGMDWTEEHRMERLRKKKPLWTFEAPMQWQPIWDKCKMVSETEKLGIKPPMLYSLGFPHNNCGGRCVAAGISHWVHLFNTLPERYMEWENEEQATMKDFAERGIGSKEFTILKDRRGGVTRNLSLKDLRLRIEAGEKLPQHDWGGCGCGTQAEMEFEVHLPLK
jgi:hypothetical protein